MGCKVKRNRHGYLAFRLMGQGIPGGRSWEGTGLKDIPENRRLVEAQALVIDAQIKTGTFDYVKWFPHGNRAGYFDSFKVKATTIGTRFEVWIKDKVPPFVRKSLARAYRQHFDAYILPRWRDREAASISMVDLNEFRTYLVKARDLKLKTAKNIIDGTFRAFFRDAQLDNIIKRNPFEDLPPRWWPVIETPPPNPFTHSERDKIASWFKRHDAHYYPFVIFHLWQSVRPSESTALRLGVVDLKRARAEIVRSRDLQHEAATKTRSARRIIELKPMVIDALKQRWPLTARQDDYLFANQQGSPINPDQFRKHNWYRCLRSLGLRPRDFYSTKDTAISLALSDGENLKKVAEEAGISVVTLEKHYGRWMSPSETSSETFFHDIKKK